MHYGALLSKYSLLCCCLYVLLSELQYSVLHLLSTPSKNGSLRKQLSICDITTDLLVQRQVWNEQRKSKLMTCHNTNTVSAFDGLKQISIVVNRQSSDFCIFCSLHDLHHFAQKPVEVLQNFSCFLSLPKRYRFSNDSEFVYHKNIFFFKQLNFKILAKFLVCWNKRLSAYLGQVSYHDNSYAVFSVNPSNTKSDQHQFSPNNTRRLQELVK